MITQKMIDVKKGFKAYGHGLVCRGKQYAENTTFEESGGETLKPDVFYKLENGAFVEVKE